MSSKGIYWTRVTDETRQFSVQSGLANDIGWRLAKLVWKKQQIDGKRRKYRWNAVESGTLRKKINCLQILFNSFSQPPPSIVPFNAVYSKSVKLKFWIQLSIFPWQFKQNWKQNIYSIILLRLYVHTKFYVTPSQYPFTTFPQCSKNSPY